MPVIPLHPPKRQLGTHVLLGQASDPLPFRVVGPNNAVLTAHRSLKAACARARWHSSTRFVYVEFEGVGDGACWDGTLGRLVTWSAALAAMGETTCNTARERQGLSNVQHRAPVIPFRKCLA